LLYAVLSSFTTANFYPDPLHLVLSPMHRGGAMPLSPTLIDLDIQDPGSELRRIPLPRRWVNRLASDTPRAEDKCVIQHTVL
jgi:hypothetical protein